MQWIPFRIFFVNSLRLLPHLVFSQQVPYHDSLPRGAVWQHVRIVLKCLDPEYQVSSSNGLKVTGIWNPVTLALLERSCDRIEGVVKFVQDWGWGVLWNQSWTRTLPIRNFHSSIPDWLLVGLRVRNLIFRQPIGRTTPPHPLHLRIA